MKIRDTLEFTISKLGELFEKQYGELPCGGWINPEIISSTPNEILIRCYYNNYNNEEDCWHYSFDPRTQQFTEG